MPSRLSENNIKIDIKVRYTIKNLFFSCVARNYLSHIDHIQDNARHSKRNLLPSKTAAIFLNPCTSYYSWAHTTGAVSVSCPFSFAFFACLLGSSPLRRGDCFPLLGRKYLAADLCFHLAVMSRMYNDYGSITRDRLEANINSINFPGFHTSPVHDPEAKEQDLKRIC